MGKRLSLGKKIGIGFGLILVLTVLVGLTGYLALGSVLAGVKLNRAIGGVKQHITSLSDNTGRYMLFNHSESRDLQQNAEDALHQNLTDTESTLKELWALEGISGSASSVMNDAEKQIAGFRESFDGFKKAESEKGTLARNISSEAAILVKDIEGVKFWIEEMLPAANFTSTYCDAFFDRNTDIRWKQLTQAVKELGKTIDDWNVRVENSDEMSAKAVQFKKKQSSIKADLAVYHSYLDQQDIFLNKMEENKQVLASHLNKLEADTLRSMDKVENFSIRLIIGAVLSSLLLGLAYATFSIRAIVAPIRNVSAGLKDIADGEGDLTIRLAVSSGDEVGELASDFNRFMGKLQALISDVAGNSQSLNNSSGSLFSLSEKLSAVSIGMSEKSNSVADSADEMSQKMASVASASEEASTNVKMVAVSAEQMTASVSEIATNTEKARQVTVEAVAQARGASTKVDELGIAAVDISKVTEVITEISEQTNLLALNATIEAARAGEAGKGFAVVANEIKELAKQTADATGEIKNKIQGIQLSTNATVSEIEQILKVINKVNDIVGTIATAVEEQSVTTREIAMNVAQAAQGIDDVNKNVAESSHVASTIAEEISAVDHSATKVSEESSQAKIGANNLSDMAEQLEQVVDRFKI